jgi:hypothetical protein
MPESRMDLNSPHPFGKFIPAFFGKFLLITDPHLVKCG